MEVRSPWRVASWQSRRHWRLLLHAPRCLYDCFDACPVSPACVCMTLLFKLMRYIHIGYSQLQTYAAHAMLIGFSFCNTFLDRNVHVHFAYLACECTSYMHRPSESKQSKQSPPCTAPPSIFHPWPHVHLHECIHLTCTSCAHGRCTRPGQCNSANRP